MAEHFNTDMFRKYIYVTIWYIHVHIYTHIHIHIYIFIFIFISILSMFVQYLINIKDTWELLKLELTGRLHGECHGKLEIEGIVLSFCCMTSSMRKNGIDEAFCWNNSSLGNLNLYKENNNIKHMLCVSAANKCLSYVYSWSNDPLWQQRIH